jgi:hypothetical protein
MSDQTTFLDDLKPVSASELMGGGGVISAVRAIDDPDPCAATGCAMQGKPAEICRDHRCPHSMEREAAENQGGREERQILSHPAGRHPNVEGGTP